MKTAGADKMEFRKDETYKLMDEKTGKLVTGLTDQK